MIFSFLQSAFSRFFAIFFMVSCCFSLLFSQQNNDGSSDASQPMLGEPQGAAPANPVKKPARGKSGQDDTQALLKKSAEKVMGIEEIRPVADEMNVIDPDYDRDNFEQIKKVIARVKGELKSFQVAVLDKKQDIDRQNSLKGFGFYQFFSTIFTDYYKYVMPAVRNQYYLVRAHKALNDADKIFQERKDIFPLVVSKEELQSVIYELKFLTALVSAFRGTKKDLLRSVVELEFLLGEKGESYKVPYISNDAEGVQRKLNLYSYLVGILDKLYFLTREDFVLSSRVLRSKIYYLWQLTAVKNAGNEELRDIKLRALYNEYFPVMDVNSRNYELHYRRFEQTGLDRAKDLETKLLEEAGKSPDEVSQQKDVQGDQALDDGGKSPAVSSPVAPEDLFQPTPPQENPVPAAPAN